MNRALQHLYRTTSIRSRIGDTIFGTRRLVSPYHGVRTLAAAAAEGDAINLTFVKPNGDKVPVSAPIGDTILEVAHDNDIEIEGACGGECACSTCHVILSEEYYSKLIPPSEEEEDMLDLAAGLTDTSRLCCQIVVESDLEDMEVQLPEEVNNML